MEGVRVLAEQIYYTYDVFATVAAAFFIAFAFVGVVAGITIVFSGITTHDPMGLCGLFFIIAAVFSGIFGFFCNNKAHESKTLNYVEKKVIVEDYVDMNEFFNHYELLDQDGEIYIVRERPID